MESRANLLSEGTCSVCPKVGEVLPTVERHEEIHDDISIPRGARAGHFGKDKVSKREIGSEGLGAGAKRKRRRRDSAAVLNEEAKRFIGEDPIGTKDETYITILWKRVFAELKAM